jgi:hypothetical protein
VDLNCSSSIKRTLKIDHDIKAVISSIALAIVSWSQIALSQDCATLLEGLVPGENYFEHPVYYQTGPNMLCGESCLFSVLEKMGWADPLGTINTDGEIVGVTADNLIQTFRNLGFRSNHYGPQNLSELNAWAKQGTSFILQIHNGVGRHFVVFEGLHDGIVEYMDPNFHYGHRKMPVEEIQSRWMGDVIWIQSAASNQK